MKYYFIDLFCGCGGVTTGINSTILRTENIAEVIACVNHDKNAILSHKSNHPEALHFTEDIRTVAMHPMVELVNKIRKREPLAKFCLWASLECVNHSNAKGGMSRDADSRTLAEHLFRYFSIDFDQIWIENVREFMSWGPLVPKFKNGKALIIEKGKDVGKPIMYPDPKYRGIDYEKWVEKVKSYGYQYEHRVLNCADFGCDTSRKRLFIQFAKPGNTIKWPAATHQKDGKDGLKKWRPVRPLLDLTETGQSIFTRKKPLAEKSLERIYKGLVKFCGETFFAKYYGNGDNVAPLSSPSPTLTTKDRLAVVSSFLHYEFGEPVQRGLEEPAPAITTRYKEKLVTANFMMDYQYDNTGNDLDKPCPTLIARMDKTPKYIISAEKFLLDAQFNNTGKSLDEPSSALTADRHQKYVVGTFIESCYSPGTVRSVDEPCATLTTVPHERIINVEYGKSLPQIQEGDTAAAVKIKLFMQKYGIVDVRMRPLFIVEMLKIMGFPADYKLVGTKTEAKKYIGNAVPCGMVTQLIAESVRANSNLS